MVSRYSTDFLMPKGIPKDGPRKSGCGRKSGEPTTTIAFRVPLKYANDLKAAFKNLLNEIKKQDPLN
jgi:hypothetical protein